MAAICILNGNYCCGCDDLLKIDKVICDICGYEMSKSESRSAYFYEHLCLKCHKEFYTL